MANHASRQLQARIENDFTYHAPTPDQIEDMVKLRDAARLLAHLVNQAVPDGREKSTALTKLEEVIFHSNAGIARA